MPVEVGAAEEGAPVLAAATGTTTAHIVAGVAAGAAVVVMGVAGVAAVVEESEPVAGEVAGAAGPVAVAVEAAVASPLPRHGSGYHWRGGCTPYTAYGSGGSRG